MSGDPRCHWHGIGFVESDHGWSCPMCPRPTEIERLRADLTAERALADQLAVALAAQGSASFDENTNLNIKRLALDAWKEARRER